MRPLPAAALLLLLALPAQAQDAPPAPRDGGAVAQLLQAHALFDLGLSRKDPLATLSAARLASGITATDSDRVPEPAGEPVPATYPTPDVMFTAAKAQAREDDLATDLAARTMAEVTRTPTLTVIRSARGIAAGGTQVWTIPFFAATLAEVGLLGDGKANLDLSVATADGTPICIDTAPADRALCTFSTPENASLTVTVTNRSETAATYSLLTN
ncbi:MAG: hypothetical protein Q27BPR15_00450 [Rhodobacter sp. CACIA14H1]|nr:MAG: hypothetical protein Q27BPR15_00450 [Rhodobacter sp. CACIA14H1]